MGPFLSSFKNGLHFGERYKQEVTVVVAVGKIVKRTWKCTCQRVVSAPPPPSLVVPPTPGRNNYDFSIVEFPTGKNGDIVDPPPLPEI